MRGNTDGSRKVKSLAAAIMSLAGYIHTGTSRFLRADSINSNSAMCRRLIRAVKNARTGAIPVTTMISNPSQRGSGGFVGDAVATVANSATANAIEPDQSPTLLRRSAWRAVWWKGERAAETSAATVEVGQSSVHVIPQAPAIGPAGSRAAIMVKESCTFEWFAVFLPELVACQRGKRRQPLKVLKLGVNESGVTGAWSSRNRPLRSRGRCR